MFPKELEKSRRIKRSTLVKNIEARTNAPNPDRKNSNRCMDLIKETWESVERGQKTALLHLAPHPLLPTRPRPSPPGIVLCAFSAVGTAPNAPDPLAGVRPLRCVGPT